MILRPVDIEDLRKQVGSVAAAGEKIEAVDLRCLNRIVDYASEDLTVTVQGGVLLSELQEELKKNGQWLPLDPPGIERITVEQLLSWNSSGPRRFGFGTVRDYLLGMAAVLGDGRLIHSGGKVVKNVAGYDLGKIFIGSRGTLGVVVEATFKLRPLPEAEQFVEFRLDSLDTASECILKLMEAEWAPVVLDLHNLGDDPAGYKMVAGFAGAREDVEDQLGKAGALGKIHPSDLSYDTRFYEANTRESIQHLSVLPSETGSVLRELGEAPFVCRAGNGVIYYRGERKPADIPVQLMKRVKAAYDPQSIFPEYPL